MEDLEAFLSPDQAQEAFNMLDNNGDGKLVLADIRDAVIKIYKERRNLALSLKVCHAPVSKRNTCLNDRMLCCICSNCITCNTLYHLLSVACPEQDSISPHVLVMQQHSILFDVQHLNYS